MKQARNAIVLSGIILMAISGCGKSDMKRVSIDHHVFNIPNRFLLEGTIPWLPASQHDGLMFYINPEAPLPERNSVLIQSTATKCPPNMSLGATPLASACRAAIQQESEAQEGEMEKIHPHSDPTQWEYHIKGDKTSSAVVATCSAMGDGNGLCHSFGNYRDLVYSVSLRDSEIESLPSIRKKIHELLSLWENSAY